MVLNFGVVAASIVGVDVYGTEFEVLWCVHSWWCIAVV